MHSIKLQVQPGVISVIAVYHFSQISFSSFILDCPSGIVAWW